MTEQLTKLDEIISEATEAQRMLILTYTQGLLAGAKMERGETSSEIKSNTDVESGICRNGADKENGAK